MAYDDAREWLGRDAARTYWDRTERYLDALERVAGDALRRTGSLRLAADEEEREELHGEYEALREDAFDAEWREPLPPPLHRRFCAAIFHPGDASVQPARMTRRVAQRAVAAGAEFYERWIESLDDVDADRVLIATDGYPSGLLGPLEGLIIPTRGQMIATEPITERLFDCPHYGRHGFDYWQQLDDGRIVAGGFRDADMTTEFTTEERTTAAIQDVLETFLADLVGRPLAVSHRWAGIFGLVLDFLPVVGRVPEREHVWVAGGYSGHGNVLGFMCGDLVAKAILGEEAPELQLFDPRRLVPVA
jgi:gamma-glutamylputrescine oxidase